MANFQVSAVTNGIEDEILTLLRDFKREIYEKLNRDETDVLARLRNADEALATAIADYEDGDYQAAVELFREALVALRELGFREESAELCVLIAACELRLGRRRAARLAFQEAHCFGLDSEHVDQLAKKWRLEKS